jgi:hypothetical protein
MFGVLLLTLHTHGYGWRFVPERGAAFTDPGSGFLPVTRAALLRRQAETVGHRVRSLHWSTTRL